MAANPNTPFASLQRSPRCSDPRASGPKASGASPNLLSLCGWNPLRFLIAACLTFAFASRAGTTVLANSTPLDLTRDRIESKAHSNTVWNLQHTTLQQLTAGSGDRVRIPLPDASSIIARFHSRTPTSTNRVTLVGDIEGIPGSQIILAVNPEAAAGSFLIPGKGAYAMLPTPDSKLRIEQTPGERALPCGTLSAASSDRVPLETFRRAARTQGPPSLPLPPTNSEPAQLDLLVAYTPAALNAAGGPAGITAQIDAAIAEANLSFSNSRVPATIHLTQTLLVAYKERGHAEVDLALLTDMMEDAYEDPGHSEIPGDEDDEYAFEPVANARKTSHSDLVCLLVEGGDNTVGVANQLWEPKPDFAPKALSVIQRGFLNHFQILAHEIGHNLGCQHERSGGESDGAFPYSHGHRFEIDGLYYRTVMATTPGITLPNFSNPEVLFLGKPTGVPATQSDSADNARTLQFTAGIAEQFDTFWTAGPPIQEVTISNPEPGSGFALNEFVEFEVKIPTGLSVTRIDYFANDTWIGSSSQPPFRFAWTSPKAGEFVIAARSTAPNGSSTLCAPIAIRFSAPPNIALKLPLKRGRAVAGQPMICEVDASDPDGQVVRVEFFADGYRIGTVDKPPFILTWVVDWPDRFLVTARATDNSGVARTSNAILAEFIPAAPSFGLKGLKESQAPPGRQFPFTGSEGTNCRLETSTDLKTWTLVKTVTMGIEPQWTPTPEGDSPTQFYRLIPVP